MECLACLGEGVHDERDYAAICEEHLPPAALAVAKAAAGENWGRVITCPECEGTGVISPERHAEMFAAARAMVDQVIAKFEEEGIA